MAGTRKGTAEKRGFYHVGLDADKVIDAAVALSHRSFTTTWADARL